MKKNRIISLFPSASDFIVNLNLENDLIAVSHECSNKHYFSELPKVTSTLIESGLSQFEIDFAVKSRLEQNQPLYKVHENLIY